MRKRGDILEYTLKDLEMWNEKIEAIVNEVGLDYYPQEFEIISYNDMLAYEVYVGCLQDILTGVLEKLMKDLKLYTNTI
jgi:spore cortex formation protein SpoVR/YcgB (stage V sporulation)